MMEKQVDKIPKRTLLLTLLSAGILAFTGGCGGLPAQDKPPSAAEETAPRNTITIMHIDAGNKHFTEFIEQAEQELDIQIEILEYPINADSRHARVSSLLAAGSPLVDIFSINDEMVSEFKYAGYLEPLQADVMNAETAAAFPQEYLQTMTMADGELYSVPFMMEFLALWVNEAFMAEARLNDVQSREGFQAFLSHDWGDGRYAYGGAWEKSYAYNEIGEFINLYGGDMYDWSNPRTREALSLMKDLIQKGFAPQDQLLDQYEQVNQKFIDGTYGMVFMYSGTISTYVEAGVYGDDKIHLAGFPALGGNSTYMATWQYVLNKASQHKDAAKRFLSYAAGREGARRYAETMNRMPARSDLIWEGELAVTGFSQFRQHMQKTHLSARPLPQHSMSYISDLGELFQSYIMDDMDLDTFCEQAQKLMDDTFKTRQERHLGLSCLSNYPLISYQSRNFSP